MLADPAEAEYHQTIAVLLGILSQGAEADGQALIDYVDLAEGSVAAKSAATISLGYVAHRGSARALDFLLERSPSVESPATGWVASGLALSGRPAALQRLQRLQADARAAVSTARNDRMSAAAAERFVRRFDGAAAANRTIAIEGLRGYYRR